MWKTRLRYGIFVIIFFILLFYFAKPFLLYSMLILVAFGVLDVLLIQRDASNLQMTIKAGKKVSTEDGLHLDVHIWSERYLFTCKSVQADFVIYNEMFDSVREECLVFHLNGRDNCYEIPLEMERCGEVCIRCESMQIKDVLGILPKRIKPFPEMRTVVYPGRMNLQIALSQATIGTPRSEGMMQNRKGNDPSEMFDIRDYVPGDDVRSIHWKLSSKTDTLILRQASEPSHYNVVILADYGREQLGEYASEKEFNGAVAAGIEVGKRLLQQNVPFCMAVPAADGLHIYEIQNEWELQQMIPQWLHITVMQNAGAGLQYFVTQHMEQYFTRLLILSAGEYRQNLGVLENRIGISVLNVSEDTENVYTIRSGSSEIVELPAEPGKGETYRIIC